jgi:hypothetical protein
MHLVKFMRMQALAEYMTLYVLYLLRTGRGFALAYL